MAWWTVFASAPASIMFGAAGFLILRLGGGHRNHDRTVAHSSIVSAITLSIVFYTLAVVLFDHWALKLPVSTTIKDGFGDERFAWLLLAFLIDTAARLYLLLASE